MNNLKRISEIDFLVSRLYLVSRLFIILFWAVLLTGCSTGALNQLKKESLASLTPHATCPSKPLFEYPLATDVNVSPRIPYIALAESDFNKWGQYTLQLELCTQQLMIDVETRDKIIKDLLD